MTIISKVVTKRARCSRCLKATAACICGTIQSISNTYPLHILQDPSEEKKALGTARILKLSLRNVKLTVGSKFNEQDFDPKNSYLLFPGDDAVDAKTLAKSSALNNDSQFILLDGSWKKAYKLLMSNPFLQQLPKVSVVANVKSNYRIRKSPREDGFSTVEAGYYLLSQLEGETEKFAPLLKTFEFMIDYQIAQMPAGTYQKNYVKK